MQLIEKVANTSNLRKSWRSLLSGKNEDARKALRGILGSSILDFKHNAEPNIEKISQNLLNGSYKIAAIKSHFIRKSDKSKHRLISPPSVEDAIVHSAILNVLKPIFKDLLNNGVSYCGIPCLPKKKRISHITALKKLHQKFTEGYYVIFESDIQSFFDTINKDLLLKKIFHSLPDSSLNEILYDIVYFKIGNYEELKNEGKSDLPPINNLIGIAQGSPLSPFFANIYLAEVDQKINEIAKSQFFRYVDDFILVAKSEKEAIRLGKIITDLFTLEGLKLASNKTNICNLLKKNSSFTFLGLNISPYSVRQKKNEKEILQIINSDYLNVKNYKSTDKSQKANIRLQGYANYYRNFHTQHMLSAINELIKERVKKVKVFSNLQLLDTSTKTQFMSIDQWRSAFCV